MKTPFPVTYRELWLPEHIRGTQLAPSARGGHALALTGASKQTTADGVHFDGQNSSLINLGAIHNAEAKFWVSLRFRPTQIINAAASIQMLSNKHIAFSSRFQLGFNFNPDGKLTFEHRTLGVVHFDLASVATSWAAGVWHHALISISNVNGARFIANGALLTDASVDALANVANLQIGNDTVDPNQSFKGDIADVFMGTDDLTLAEEADLAKGIPPADAVNVYMLDEGRALTALDRGTGGNNGTLSATAIWAFGQVIGPAISLDGINDYAASASDVNISGALTLAVVTKAKNVLDTALADSVIALLRVGANDYLKLYHNNGADGVEFIASGGGTAQTLSHLVEQIIGDYRIYVATLTAAGIITLYVNGVAVATAPGVGAISGAAATAYLGATNTPDAYGNDKNLFTALIDGAMTDTQVKTYSRWLRDKYNLPVGV